MTLPPARAWCRKALAAAPRGACTLAHPSALALALRAHGGRSCRPPGDSDPPAPDPGPQAVVVVPHRELGRQLALLIYRLLGGSVANGLPGDRANMFTYTGPRNVKVKGCLDKEEVLRAKNAGHLEGATIVVGTPECLAECMQDPEALDVMKHAKVRVA
jgi:hypothetical protein